MGPTLGRTPTEKCKAGSLAVPWAAQVAERAHVQVEGVTRPACIKLPENLLPST